MRPHCVLSRHCVPSFHADDPSAVFWQAWRVRFSLRRFSFRHATVFGSTLLHFGRRGHPKGWTLSLQPRERRVVEKIARPLTGKSFDANFSCTKWRVGHLGSCSSSSEERIL